MKNTYKKFRTFFHFKIHVVGVLTEQAALMGKKYFFLMSSIFRIRIEMELHRLNVTSQIHENKFCQHCGMDKAKKNFVYKLV
jgi:hypothetical protein